MKRTDTKIEPGQIRANAWGTRLIYLESAGWRDGEWFCIVLWPHRSFGRSRTAVSREILASYPLVCTLEVT